MDRFFSPDSKFSAAMMMAADLVILNVLAIVCSLPLITIGASARALFTVSSEMVQDNAIRPIPDFFAAFLKELPKTVAVSIVMVLAIALGCYEYVVITRADLGSIATLVLSAGLVSGELIIFSIAMWWLGLMTVGRASTSLAATLAIAHLPRTAAALLASGAWLLLLLVAPTHWGFVLGFQVIIGFALSAYLVMLVIRPVLVR